MHLTYEDRRSIREAREAGLMASCPECVGAGLECEACCGTGVDLRMRWVSCEMCGGSGEVEVRPIVGPYEDPTPHGELCSACGGTGRDCVEVSPVECDDDQQ